MEIVSEKSAKVQATKEWLHEHHFLFTPTAIFTWGLATSYYLVEYACLSIIVTFYINVAMKDDLAGAAIVSCVQEGLASLGAIVLARFTGNKFSRRFYVIVFSTGSYIAGVIILWSYAKQKAQDQEKNLPLFLMLSCLFGIGKGGSDPVLKSFLEDNLCAVSSERTSLTAKRAEIYKNIWVHSAWIVGAIIAIFGFLGFEWPQVLGVSIMVIIPSLILFLFGTNISGLIKAHSSSEVLKNNATTTVPIKRVTNMKWLLMFSCIAYSLVLGTGSILFQEQSTKMKSLTIKGDKVRFSFLIVLKTAVNEITTLIYRLYGDNKKKGIKLVRIGSGMVCAIICCVIAWKVEIDRPKGLGENDPNRTSVVWLCPHYVLLGLVEGLAQSGLEELFGNDDEKQTMRNPGKITKDMVAFVGKFLGIPCILIVKRWFKNFDKESHLERYYLMLGILSCVFFCIYLVVAFVYMKVIAADDLEAEVSNNGITDRVHHVESA